MGSGRWVQGDFVSVSREKAEDLSPNTARPGDLIFTQRGTLGQVAIVPSHRYDRYIVSQSQMKLTVNSDIADVLFVYYYFKAPQQQDYIKRSTIQTGVPHTNLELLRTTPVILPPLLEQRAIAGVLGALDDKIELNRRMNETLEAMAQAVFKSWFVDFDPVRAKAQGRRPACMDAATARLFPDSFVDSVLGEIPKGWRTRPLDEIAAFLNGLPLQKFPATGERYLPVIKIAEMRRGCTGASDRASINIPREYVVEDGDILFSWSGSLAVCIWAGGRGALNQHLFKVTSTRYPNWFCYQWIRHHLPDFQAIAAGKATTMGHIQRYHLHDAFAVTPPDQLLSRIDGVMAPTLRRTTLAWLESRSLAALRDTLLPKLLSGEIRVKAAEKMVAGAL
jgi:type I restriction enzyme S subunit